MLFRKKFIWAELESTYGTDPTPTNADTVLTSNLSIIPYQGNLVRRDLDREVLGAQLAINTGPNVQVSFEVELVGSGTADSPPAGWGKLLQACGFGESITVTTGPVDYDPISDFTAADTSVTIYFFHDGKRQIIKGARGNVEIRLVRGEIPRLVFTMLGFYARPTDASGTRDVSAYLTPIPVTNANTGTFELMGYTTGVYESMVVNMNNNVVYRNVINDERVLIVDRDPSIEIVVEETLAATQDWFADLESHAGITTGALNVVHDTGTGRAITLSGPAVQLLEATLGESDGVSVLTISGALTPSSGDDEFQISIN